MSCVGAQNAPGPRPTAHEAGGGAGQPAMSRAEQATIAAGLALDIVAAAGEYSWPDGTPVTVRVGVHCGPALAGVLGGKLPRWGLFGSTPILASRMESHGAPSRVHVSAEFARALGDRHPRFAITKVSPAIDVKGVGYCDTYWVTAKTGGVDAAPPPLEPAAAAAPRRARARSNAPRPASASPRRPRK